MYVKLEDRHDFSLNLKLVYATIVSTTKTKMIPISMLPLINRLPITGLKLRYGYIQNTLSNSKTFKLILSLSVIILVREKHAIRSLRHNVL